MADVLLLIRRAVELGKKVFCHGFGFFAAHYLLVTGFDKHYEIAKVGGTGQVDFEWQPETGDLSVKGQRVCSSGVVVEGGSRPFAERSAQAVSRGLTLGSKFEHVVFDAKSGSRLLRNIQSPFGFYWKSKLFCKGKGKAQSKADILFETESGAPLAFTHKNLLAVQGFC